MESLLLGDIYTVGLNFKVILDLVSMLLRGNRIIRTPCPDPSRERLCPNGIFLGMSFQEKRKIFKYQTTVLLQTELEFSLNDVSI